MDESAFARVGHRVPEPMPRNCPRYVRRPRLRVGYNRAMPLHRLARHPDTPSTAIEQIEVALERAARGVRLSYRLIGLTERVAVTPPAPGTPPRRRDELWRSTCCELFLRDAGGTGYREYNFAPCGDWAAYRFSGYRTGCVPLETHAPQIVLERSPEAIALTVTLTDLPLDELVAAQPIGLACIVATSTELSYWALAHPAGKPDFHHASAFASTFGIGRPAHSAA
jgi:hypothetical protein